MPLPLCLLLAAFFEAAEAPPATEALPIAEIRKVVGAVVRAAEENIVRKQGQLSGDALADFYVRRAAAAAVADKASSRAFLSALGVVLDHTNLLRSNPLMGRVLSQIEDDDERRRRLRVLGQPHLRGRSDWLLHFSIAAALTAQLGPESAEQLSIAKELWDAKGTSGFSFGDLAADYAGIEFALALLSDSETAPQRLRLLAEQFRGDDYLDKNADLEEGISLDRFTQKYGNARDPRFLEKTKAIRERVRKAPGLARLRSPGTK